MKGEGDVIFSFLPFFPSNACFHSTSLQEKESRLRERSALRASGHATDPQLLPATLNMQRPKLGCFLLLFVFLSPPLPAGGQTGARRGGTERIQMMFTPTICKVLCNQDGCINRCEKGNMTTLYSTDGGLGGRRDGAHGPGFRVCKCSSELHDPGQNSAAFCIKHQRLHVCSQMQHAKKTIFCCVQQQILRLVLCKTSDEH